MRNIHSTAVIHPFAKIGKDVSIGPYSVIGANVVVMDGVTIHSHVSIGAPAQHRTHSGEQFGIFIDHGTVIREYVSVHLGTKNPTTIGKNCYIMACAHVAHDCVIENDVTMANNCLLGGHCVVMRGANLGLGVIAHQYAVIGSYSMLGMGTIVTKASKIEPGNIYIGNPARFLKKNEVGLERNGITEKQLEIEKEIWKKT